MGPLYHQGEWAPWINIIIIIVIIIIPGSGIQKIVASRIWNLLWSLDPDCGPDPETRSSTNLESTCRLLQPVSGL